LSKGTAVAALFNEGRIEELKPGAWLSKVLEAEIGWQLENPEKGEAEIKSWLQQSQDKFTT
jgi:hypothetical protein